MEPLTTSLLSTSAQREIPGSGRERIRVVLSIHRLCSTYREKGRKKKKKGQSRSLLARSLQGEVAAMRKVKVGELILITESRCHYCGSEMCSLETSASFPSSGSDIFICFEAKENPNNCTAVNTASLSGRFDLYVVVSFCSNAAVFFSPLLAQCRKLFLLPHYIILQHL